MNFIYINLIFTNKKNNSVFLVASFAYHQIPHAKPETVI